MTMFDNVDRQEPERETENQKDEYVRGENAEDIFIFSAASFFLVPFRFPSSSSIPFFFVVGGPWRATGLPSRPRAGQPSPVTVTPASPLHAAACAPHCPPRPSSSSLPNRPRTDCRLRVRHGCAARASGGGHAGPRPQSPQPTRPLLHAPAWLAMAAAAAAAAAGHEARRERRLGAADPLCTLEQSLC